MTNLALTAPNAPRLSLGRCVRQALPREQGSWSFAFEPVALGLIAAPSLAGVLLALAAVAGFFARRPLKLLVRGAAAEERTTALVTLLPLTLLAGVALVLSLRASSPELIVWLFAAAVPTAVFASFDARNASRDVLAELAGATSFALLAAAIVAAAGWGRGASCAVGVAMLGRSLPTLLCLRARIRGQKSGTIAWRIPVVAALAAVLAATAMSMQGLMPASVVVALAALAVRTGVVLGAPGTHLRAKTLGIGEAALGAAFVIVAGIAFR